MHYFFVFIRKFKNYFVVKNPIWNFRTHPRCPSWRKFPTNFSWIIWCTQIPHLFQFQAINVEEIHWVLQETKKNEILGNHLDRSFQMCYQRKTMRNNAGTQYWSTTLMHIIRSELTSSVTKRFSAKLTGSQIIIRVTATYDRHISDHNEPISKPNPERQ